MNNSNQNTSSINFDPWFSRSYEFKNVEYSAVCNAVLKVIENGSFKIKRNESSSNRSDILAIRGRRIIWALVPFGKYGKRLSIRATVLKDDTIIRVHLRVTPYMEWINEEEVSGFTQSTDEVFFDDYFTAKNLIILARELHHKLSLPLPRDLIKFDRKEFIKYNFLRLLIFPTLDLKQGSRIHIPPKSLRKWNWQAFAIPEIWFVWNNVGATLGGLAFLLSMMCVISFVSENTSVSIKLSSLILALLLRIVSGRTANVMFYARHGKFAYNPDRKSFDIPVNGPRWSWPAFVVPEFWFLWNEMWGVGMLTIAIDTICFFTAFFNMTWRVLYITLGVILLNRLILGFIGNRIFFYRYGRWPKSKYNIV